jgi:hypothetical protein
MSDLTDEKDDGVEARIEAWMVRYQGLIHQWIADQKLVGLKLEGDKLVNDGSGVEPTEDEQGQIYALGVELAAAGMSLLYVLMGGQDAAGVCRSLHQEVRHAYQMAAGCSSGDTSDGSETLN